jgi:xanthine/CO dehydrogenase XdhC/CoxF family maturation factor
MTDLDQILPLWHELKKSGTEYVLATVVAVDGSGYRKPGARMLIAADGRRAGTISGGCLEGEVARKAFWRTEEGPVVHLYSTNPDDGEIPYGMGCGGVVHVLLERSSNAGPILERLDASFAARKPMSIATFLDGPQLGERAYFPSDSDTEDQSLAEIARASYDQGRTLNHAHVAANGEIHTIHAEWCSARPGLFVFGAGDDAIPLVKQARQLGWYVAVSDGRSNLPTRSRFPEAHAVQVLGSDVMIPWDFRSSDSVVIMTHSLEQDRHILAQVLVHSPGYIGLLGPLHRTHELLRLMADDLGLSDEDAESAIQAWMGRVHAPMGLDLGGDTPADIALATIAEIQLCLHRTSGAPLRRVRGLSGTRITKTVPAA